MRAVVSRLSAGCKMAENDSFQDIFGDFESTDINPTEVTSVGEGGENARRTFRAFLIGGIKAVPKVRSVATGVGIEF